jgi:hypothetical protein
LQGAGGSVRQTAHALLMIPWSGSCSPAGTDPPGAEAAFEGTTLRSASRPLAGGRGEARGAVDLVDDPAAGGRDLPSGLALVAPPRSGGGPTAALSGLLLVASAFAGAVLARLVECVRSDPGEERA